jgi:predicted helicase
MDFNNILEKYRKYSFSERGKGTRFERLMQTYLQTDPQYACKFKKVWLWNDFLGKCRFRLNMLRKDIPTLARIWGLVKFYRNI